MGNWFDIFKTGTHTDTTGKPHLILDQDLKRIERKFNESNDDAPLVVGHPKTNDPAYGWVKRLRVVGDKLQGLAGEVVPQFAEAVRQRMYKKISVSLRPDFSIRHIGFLGAVPPAVKGLNAVPISFSFSEDPDAFDIEFAEGDLNFSDSWFALSRIRTIGRLMQSMRDYILGKDGIEIADKVAPQSDIDWLKEDPPQDPVSVVLPVPAEVKSFNEHITPDRGKEDKLEKIEKPAASGPEQPAVDFAEKVNTLEGENSTLRTKVKDLERKKIEGEAANFVEKLGGKLLPKFKKGVIELLVNLQEAGSEINFSETEKKPSGAFLMEFMESMPVQVPTKELGKIAGDEDDGISSEYSEANTDPDRLDLHKKAKALEKKEKISYSDALARVTKGGK